MTSVRTHKSPLHDISMSLPCTFRLHMILPELHFSYVYVPALVWVTFFPQSHWHTCSLVFPVVVGQPSLSPQLKCLMSPKFRVGAFHWHMFSPHLTAVSPACAEVGARFFLLDVNLCQHSGLRLSWKYLTCWCSQMHVLFSRRTFSFCEGRPVVCLGTSVRPLCFNLRVVTGVFSRWFFPFPSVTSSHPYNWSSLHEVGSHHPHFTNK